MPPPKHQLEMAAFLETVPRADAQVQYIKQGRVWRIVGKENVNQTEDNVNMVLGNISEEHVKQSVEQTQKASISSGVRRTIVEVRVSFTPEGKYVVWERWAEAVARWPEIVRAL